MMGHKQLLLVDSYQPYQLDCMGHIEKPSDICHKKFPEKKNLTLAFAAKVSKVIVCEWANDVRVNVTCKDRFKYYCDSPKQRCEFLKDRYAHDLELLQVTGDKFKMSCYFQAKNNKIETEEYTDDAIPFLKPAI